jgi:hypothetical protein
MMLKSIIAFPIPFGKAEEIIFHGWTLFDFYSPTSSTHSTNRNANPGTEAFGNGRK